MELLLNLLNPVYVLGNIVREADSAVNACDFSQPHTWLLVASGFCIGEAGYLLLKWLEQTIVTQRKP